MTRWYFPSKYNMQDFQVDDYIEMQAERFQDRPTHESMEEFGKMLDRVHSQKDELTVFFGEVDEHTFNNTPSLQDLYGLFRLVSSDQGLKFTPDATVWRFHEPLWHRNAPFRLAVSCDSGLSDGYSHDEMPEQQPREDLPNEEPHSPEPVEEPQSNSELPQEPRSKLCGAWTHPSLSFSVAEDGEGLSFDGIFTYDDKEFPFRLSLLDSPDSDGEFKGTTERGTSGPSFDVRLKLGECGSTAAVFYRRRQRKSEAEWNHLEAVKSLATSAPEPELELSADDIASAADSLLNGGTPDSTTGSQDGTKEDAVNFSANASSKMPPPSASASRTAEEVAFDTEICKQLASWGESEAKQIMSAESKDEFYQTYGSRVSKKRSQPPIGDVTVTLRPGGGLDSFKTRLEPATAKEVRKTEQSGAVGKRRAQEKKAYLTRRHRFVDPMYRRRRLKWLERLQMDKNGKNEAKFRMYYAKHPDDAIDWPTNKGSNSVVWPSPYH